MFRISRRLDYGIQLMIALASNTSDQPQPSAQLSEQLQIPLPFLHQIAHTLMQSGLIKASPGPRGGLRLSQAPETVTVLKIAEVLEGPICVTPCLDCNDGCVREELCPALYMWKDLQEKIVDHMDGVTLKLLADQTAEMALNQNQASQPFEISEAVPAD